MGLMDNMKSKMQDMGGDMRERYEYLKTCERDGTLDDKGRAELSELRQKFEMGGE